MIYFTNNPAFKIKSYCSSINEFVFQDQDRRFCSICNSNKINNQFSASNSYVFNKFQTPDTKIFTYS